MEPRSYKESDYAYAPAPETAERPIGDQIQGIHQQVMAIRERVGVVLSKLVGPTPNKLMRGLKEPMQPCIKITLRELSEVLAALEGDIQHVEGIL